MTEYHVKWEIDLDAETPAEAARKALGYVSDPLSVAHVFEVVEHGKDDQDAEMVDLDEHGGIRKPFHGFEIVTAVPRRGHADEWEVVVDRGDEYGDFERYVEFWADDLTSVGWGSGHYFTKHDEAIGYAVQRAGWTRP